MSLRPRISVLRLRQLSMQPESLTGRRSRVASWSRSIASGAPRASRARSRRSPGPTSRRRARRSAATRTPPEYRRTLDHFTAALEELGFTVTEDPVGTLVARNRPPGRARLRDRLALRLEPQRRPLRRDAGRRHRARGLPPERGARPRPAAPADLVPRGGGLGLRPDAAREPDHAPARERGRPPRAVSRARRRAELLGARRGRRLRARALAGVDPRARRAHRLDRDAHRAGARPAGHGQADRRRERDRRLRPRRRRRHGPRRPRGGDPDGPAARSDDGARRDRARARAARDGGGRRDGRHRGRDRGRPGADQRGRRAGALLARRARSGGRALPARRDEGRGVRARRRASGAA